MAKLKPVARFVPKARLTAEEFASLKEVGARRAIPDEHRNRLLKTGYIRVVVVDPKANTSALALTGAGRHRLESGK